MPPKDTSLAGRLAAWRRAHNTTQKEAAIELGTAFRTYQDWERGVCEPVGLARHYLLRLLDEHESQPTKPKNQC